jgi:putative phosphoribosyl transferase
MLFIDRIAAGQRLASQLNIYANRSDVVVIGLARGGIPVAFAVASKLNLLWDILLVRKLGVPGNPELAMGAIASKNIRSIEREIVADRNLSPAIIEEVVEREQAELARREKLYFASDYLPLDVKELTVILVDDGLATGATMLAAIEAMQLRQPKSIIVAIPIGVKEVCEKLEKSVDGVICLATPQPFRAVSIWYDNFPQLTDEEVISFLLSRSTLKG